MTTFYQIPFHYSTAFPPRFLQSNVHNEKGKPQPGLQWNFRHCYHFVSYQSFLRCHFIWYLSRPQDSICTATPLNGSHSTMMQLLLNLTKPRLRTSLLLYHLVVRETLPSNTLRARLWWPCLNPMEQSTPSLEMWTSSGDMESCRCPLTRREKRGGYQSLPGAGSHKLNYDMIILLHKYFLRYSIINHNLNWYIENDTYFNCLCLSSSNQYIT